LGSGPAKALGLLIMLGFTVPRVWADGVGIEFSGPASMPGGLLTYCAASCDPRFPFPVGILNGTRIPITQVGVDDGSTPATVQGLTCGTAACGWLQFTTGALLSGTSTAYTFNGGGMVTVMGTLPGQTGPATTLVSSVFVGPVAVTQISGTTWQLIGNISVTSASSSVLALFPNLQLPSDGTLSSVVIVFHMRPNGTFIGDATGTNLLLSTAPEPSSMVLFGSGLLGVGCFLRRKKKQAKAAQAQLMPA